ncbi:MAG TPA: hypothetical protein VHL11_13695 [Phototrophicaceae bacterium]|jgi:predicted GH43/DUF377 family glycosyl hydrolase|nr:hypothetical protein [Phototrophicaceae bacterium]
MMMKNTLRFGFLLFVVFLLTGLTVLQAQDTPTPTSTTDALFTIMGDVPVIDNADTIKAWDGVYTDPGAVFYHDGMFHMFRNGFNGWPASVQIGYSTSVDGITWTQVTPDPILHTDDVPYAGVAALASDAFVMDDGTWVLYFYTWEKSSGTNSPGAIGRATASDPVGPWTVDPEPVLQPGSPDSWDGNQVSASRVVKTDDGYLMYYAGNKSGNQSNMIGLATSSDGITWTKYDDPATTEAPFAESDPILVSDNPKAFVNQPMVQHTPDGWVMIYRQMERPVMSLHLALSEDGIHWTVPSSYPIFGMPQMPRKVQFWYTALVYHDDIYYLYVEGNVGSRTSIFVATHEGSLVE